jgi:ABC-type Fe3+/spermidine/putrescine transport system ATPase subunit
MPSENFRKEAMESVAAVAAGKPGMLQAGANRTGVKIVDLTKDYAGTLVVDGVNLDIQAGEFVTLLGPSGSGKSTTLMAIAGFVEDYRGEIRLGDRRIDRLPPHKRDVGVVFQNFALFPHMNVANNVGFPLRMRGIGGAQLARQVRDALALVELSGFDERLPSQLSGGQQQRVALARALVFAPRVLLLDEPFAALDRKLRESMQTQLVALHQRLGITMINVTHDQAEAIALSDRIAILNHGRVEQFGTPGDIYARPQSRFVADFVGESNFITGVVGASDGACQRIDSEGGLSFLANCGGTVASGSRVTVMIRPERIQVEAETHGMNRITGTVRSVVFTGDRIKYEVALNEKETMSAVTLNQSGVARAVGETIALAWSPESAVLIENARMP